MTFDYQAGQLCAELVALDLPAKALGTPLYIYDLDRIRTNYWRLSKAFASLDAAIHYSLKANGNLAIIRALLAEGAAMDAVSGGEIYRALQAGANPAHIVFAGVGKTEDELTYALDQKVGCFNVESSQELARLNRLAAARNIQATVALRLNPDVQAQTHKYTATGHAAAKFGIGIDEARALLAQLEQYPALAIVGLHVHIGSQLQSTDETQTATRRALEVIDDFPFLNRLNLGGGFPVAYNDELYPPIEAFAEVIGAELAGRTPEKLALSLEPGRYLVAEAGILIVTVQYIKHVGQQRIIVTDGGMTELIRPALYGARHPIRPLREPPADVPVTEAQVVGPICESADVLHPAAPLPDVQSGDQLAIHMVGAYGAVMGSNYNARLRPPEVVIEGETWRIVRQRETWADLVRLEQLSEAPKA